MTADESKRTHWIGFDLGGTKMQATIFAAGLKTVATERKKTKAQKGQQAGLDRIVRTVQAVLDKAGVPADTLAGIGVGSPGPRQSGKNRRAGSRTLEKVAARGLASDRLILSSQSSFSLRRSVRERRQGSRNPFARRSRGI